MREADKLEAYPTFNCDQCRKRHELRHGFTHI